MSKIMIAVDLSSYSAGVVAAGIELARSTKSPVVLLTIVDKVAEVVPVIEAGGAAPGLWQEKVDKAEEYLEDYKAAYPDVKIEVISTLGSPKEDILEQAVEQQATVLVVGTHGRTGLDHFLLGSTAEYVIRHSHIPVLVVPYKQQRH